MPPHVDRPRITSFRHAGRPLKKAVRELSFLRLRWLHFFWGIERIETELRRLRPDTARVLRHFGATVAPDAIVIGPLSLINADRDFSNLVIGSKVHIGSEVFIDLVERVTIEDGATLSMRSCILTHFDIGHGPLAKQRPRETGGVRIAAGAYLGVAAVVLHGVTVGQEAIVGAGALARTHVPDRTVVVGVPARAVPVRPPSAR